MLKGKKSELTDDEIREILVRQFRRKTGRKDFTEEMVTQDMIEGQREVYQTRELLKQLKAAEGNLFTPREAAEYLKVSTQTLAGWRSKRTGPRFIKTGRHVKYAKEDLDKYLRTATVKTQ